MAKNSSTKRLTFTGMFILLFVALCTLLIIIDVSTKVIDEYQTQNVPNTPLVVPANATGQ